MQNKLLDFSLFESSNSKFTSELQKRGGNITFSNSGKGGNKKFFNLSLETFLNCLNDINNNITEFQGHETYIEKEWRDLGSRFFDDGPANAQITVQTKPMFSTLSKIIMWANAPSLNHIDPEQKINLEQSKIDKAILKIDELTNKFKPIAIKADRTGELSSKSIRDFALMVFDYFFNSNWEALLNESQIKDSKINSTQYKIYDHEWFKNLIGEFDSPQNKESLSSSNTIRFFERPIYIRDDKYYYFTTQWNANGDYNLSFKNLKNFIENRFTKYKLVQDEKTFILLLEDKSYSKLTQIEFNLKKFQQTCESSGLKYNTELITRYIASLTTKPFVLLSGLSGSGKTKLAQAFAQWIAEDTTQYCIVPVGADWTNREPLLGYVNALNDNEYIKPENGALQLIIDSNSNKQKPYFLILDEMNLSHVERYFADFLSVMESKDILKLHSSDEYKSNVPAAIDWPKNLFIVGTVNIDETTYMFSPKVLDRANVIEFRVNKDDIAAFLNAPQDIDFTNLNFSGGAMGEDFIKIASNKDFPTIDTTKLNEKLVLFFVELKKTGAEFGYRSASEIHRLYNQLSSLDSEMHENTKIDIAIMQKLLPKLHGSRRKLCPILETLAALCVTETTDVIKAFLNNKEAISFSDNKDVLYPLSLEKITRMYSGAIDNGFASYAEA
jgi:energy-coupling factor transporter ATP-binding protein EcfA2